MVVILLIVINISASYTQGISKPLLLLLESVHFSILRKRCSCLLKQGELPIVEEGSMRSRLLIKPPSCTRTYPAPDPLNE